MKGAVTIPGFIFKPFNPAIIGNHKITAKPPNIFPSFSLDIFKGNILIWISFFNRRHDPSLREFSLFHGYFQFEIKDFL
jgi:hypothetical protein